VLKPNLKNPRPMQKSKMLRFVVLRLFNNISPLLFIFPLPLSSSLSF
jgi:hypothetical protein